MSLIVDSSYKLLIDSITSTAAPNSTTIFSYQLTQTLILFGFTMIQAGASFGDYLSISIVDQDNVLGYGKNFVAASPVIKAYVDPSTTLAQFISNYGKTIPSGLYVSISYTNTSQLATVQTAVNLHFVTPT